MLPQVASLSLELNSIVRSQMSGEKFQSFPNDLVQIASGFSRTWTGGLDSIAVEVLSLKGVGWRIVEKPKFSIGFGNINGMALC